MTSGQVSSNVDSDTVDNTLANNSRFLKACRGEAVDATPVWLMRQAGRYMSEYRELRKTYTILEMIKSPELACEVTMQPINAFDLDAAIVFADILPPLETMGLQLEFIKGEGPVIHNPVTTPEDVTALVNTKPEETLHFTLEAIRLIRKQLDPVGIPLIGFSGAPFTLASYAIEGGSSRNYINTKIMMMGNTAVWNQLMTKLSELVGNYLLAQAKAGAQALQIFDSWVGSLSPDDYREHVMPFTRNAIEIAKDAGVPIIHFGTDTNGMLELIQEAGGDVIGVDWKINLDDAWRRLGSKQPVQGNLDPVSLFAPWPEIKRRAKAVMDNARKVNPDGSGHIFNLGHGILPQTPVENVKQLVDFVHDYSSNLNTNH